MQHQQHTMELCKAGLQKAIGPPWLQAWPGELRKARHGKRADASVSSRIIRYVLPTVAQLSTCSLSFVELSPTHIVECYGNMTRRNQALSHGQRGECAR